ncbi:lipid-A-disaccharide synthase [Veillonella criceti]|uniref:Lipid-A-disaccharide synthase n=1 Tax=Veillonella criceti TaxID=103891 RepID=A0A380NLB0_9FIRM|nr:lipid-A-disaccharide synthase [Veillonella criceti]SUP42201.1 Lipid-A-disaccharide synthase [Veillonella criceti]
MKVMFSAGEASGDTHAASVAKALKNAYPEVSMFGMGGSRMAEAGVQIMYDIKQLGYIGIVEVIKHLPSFFKLRTFLKEVMLREKPDVLVCVDYPGFNMKLAKVAHDLGIPVIYYIAPTIWAWHRSRGKDIASTVTKVASIFPFEAKAYREFGVDVEFVGHPLLDIVKPTMSLEEGLAYFKMPPHTKRVLLMPGSRKQEVISLLERMLAGAELVMAKHPNLVFYLPRAHTIDKEELEVITKKYKVPVTITDDYTYDLMQCCDVCLAASGTATLETALMELPTILLYRLSPITYALGRVLVNLTHVGLPNIVAGREVIPELLQGAVTPANIAKELTSLLEDSKRREAMVADLRSVREALGGTGAVERVAELIATVARANQVAEDMNGKL